MKKMYVFLWQTNSSQEDFNQRVPALMNWLENLRRNNQLKGCGGFENGWQGGMTLVQARSKKEAEALLRDCPLNEIGKTETHEWNIWDTELNVAGNWSGWWRGKSAA